MFLKTNSMLCPTAGVAARGLRSGDCSLNVGEQDMQTG